MPTSNFVSSYRQMRLINVSATRIVRWYRSLRVRRNFVQFTRRIVTRKRKIFTSWRLLIQCLLFRRQHLLHSCFSQLKFEYQETQTITKAFKSLWNITICSKRGTINFAIKFTIRLVFSSKGSVFSGSHLLPGLALLRVPLFSHDLLSLVSSLIKTSFFHSAREFFINRNILRALASSKLRDVSRTIPWALRYEGGLCLWHGEFMQLVLRMWRFYTSARIARRYKQPIPTTIQVPLLLRENYLCAWAAKKKRKAKALSFYNNNIVYRSWNFLKIYARYSKKKKEKIQCALRYRTRYSLSQSFTYFKIFSFRSRWSYKIANVTLKAWKQWTNISLFLTTNSKIVQANISSQRLRVSFHNWRMAYHQRHFLSVYSTSILQGCPLEVLSVSYKRTVSLRFRDTDSRGVLTAVQACLFFLGDPDSQSNLIIAWKVWVSFSIRKRAWRKLKFLIMKSYAHKILRVVFESWRNLCNKKSSISSNTITCDRLSSIFPVEEEFIKFMSISKSDSTLETIIDDEILAKSLLVPMVYPLDSSATILLSRIQGSSGDDFNYERVPRRSSLSALLSYVQQTSCGVIIRSPLHIAADECDERRVRELLGFHSSKKLVNSIDKKGRRPLHFASRHASDKYIGIIILLIECGAHVLAKDDDGKTSIDVATNLNIQLLLRSHVQRLQNHSFTHFERHVYRSRCIHTWRSIEMFDMLFIIVHAYFQLHKGRQLFKCFSLLDNSSQSSQSTQSTQSNDNLPFFQILSNIYGCDVSLKKSLRRSSSCQPQYQRLIKASMFFIDNGISSSVLFKELLKAQELECEKQKRLRLFTKDRSHFLIANADMRSALLEFIDCRNNDQPFLVKNMYKDATLQARISYRKREMLEKLQIGSINDPRMQVVERMLSEFSRSTEPELQLIRTRTCTGIGVVHPVNGIEEQSSQMLSALYQLVENPTSPSLSLESISSGWTLVNEDSKQVLVQAALGNEESLLKTNDSAKNGMSSDPFSSKLLLDSAEMKMRKTLLDASKTLNRASALLSSGKKETSLSKAVRRSSINDILSKMFMLQRLRKAFASSTDVEVDPISTLFFRKAEMPSAQLAIRKQAVEAHRIILSKSDAYAALIFISGDSLVDSSPLLRSWDLLRARLGFGYFKTLSHTLSIENISGRNAALSIYSHMQLEASIVPPKYEPITTLPLQSHLGLQTLLPQKVRRLSTSFECSLLFQSVVAHDDDPQHSSHSPNASTALLDIDFFTTVYNHCLETKDILQRQQESLETRKKELSHCLDVCMTNLVNVEKTSPDSKHYARSFHDLQLSSSALKITLDAKSRELSKAQDDFSHCSLSLADAIKTSSLRSIFRTPPEVVDCLNNFHIAERRVMLALRSQKISNDARNKLTCELNQKYHALVSKSSTLLVDIDLLHSQMSTVDESLSFGKLKVSQAKVRLAEIESLLLEARVLSLNR
jgi:hypothetical protein